MYVAEDIGCKSVEGLATENCADQFAFNLSARMYHTVDVHDMLRCDFDWSWSTWPSLTASRVNRKFFMTSAIAIADVREDVDGDHYRDR